MTGKEYADLIASYLVEKFSSRGIIVYREVSIGKSIIGKNRRIDIFVYNKILDAGLALECKYQETPGTVDEKIPYTLRDMEELGRLMPAFVVYAGEGFSEGVLHLLQSSVIAAYCMPDIINPAASSKSQTQELDHLLAISFKWWDLLIRDKKPFDPRRYRSLFS